MLLVLSPETSSAFSVLISTIVKRLALDQNFLIDFVR